jgi:hypothetical protein
MPNSELISKKAIAFRGRDAFQELHYKHAWVKSRRSLLFLSRFSILEEEGEFKRLTAS